jgi:hypothetical protein
MFFVTNSLLLIFCMGIAAAQEKQFTARELFYVPAATSTAKPSHQDKGAPPKKPTEQAQKTPSKTSNKVNPAEPRHPQPSRPVSQPVMLMAASYQGPNPLGLRYCILKLGSDGEWNEVSTDTVFHSGDKIRVQVESNESGYLYIIMRGTSGNWRPLFPSHEIRGGDNRIEAMEPQMIPSGRGVFTFDGQKGEEKLFLVLSRQEVRDLEQLIYDLNQSSKPATKKTATPAKPADSQKPGEPKRMLLAQNISPIDDALVGRLRSNLVARDLVFEKIDDSTPQKRNQMKETAVYVVEKSGRPDARLVVDIKLIHQ